MDMSLVRIVAQRITRNATTSVARSAILVGAVLSTGVLACGACVEDKVAATYDHAVITRAVADRHVVVFAAIDGPSDGRTLSAAARRAASGLSGIDRRSLRVAADPVALSFALDPRVQTPKQAVAAIEKRSTTRGLKLTVLRVID